METLRHIANPGLCANCQCKRQIQSDRGSIFYFCERSKTDPNFPKYPRLPVLQCAGYDPSPAASNEKSQPG